MRSLCKLVTRLGLIALLSTMPLTAELVQGWQFTTPFPFYMGKTLMPSGTYTLTQPENGNLTIAFIKSMDGLHAAALGVTLTKSSQVSHQSEIVFEKYGNTLYFDRALVAGGTNGIAAVPTKAEKRAEEMASVTEERSPIAGGKS